MLAGSPRRSPSDALKKTRFVSLRTRPKSAASRAGRGLPCSRLGSRKRNRTPGHFVL